MKLLFLTNNPEVTSTLYDWLITNGEEVLQSRIPVNAEFLLENSIGFIISYNYSHLISRDVLGLLPHRIINLHISLLPYNRGADPNIWSFIDNTPSGVTIHEIDEGLDTGDILLQRTLDFDSDIETLRSSYKKLHKTIQTLFIDNWESIKTLRITPKKQSAGGSMHKKKDLLYLSDTIDYDETVSQFLEKAKEYTGK